MVSVVPSGKSSKCTSRKIQYSNGMHFNLKSYPVNVLVSSLSLVTTGDDRPELGDLFINVIPQYAANWEALGAILGLKHYEIAVISKDNANRSTEGCTAMLMKWLQSVDQPTWGKLDDAINLLTTSLTGVLSDTHIRGRLC